LACAALPALLPLGPAVAQQLATLHVRALTASADRTTVHPGEAFHLTMIVRLDEPVAALDNVTLPDLSGFDVSGDERRCTATPHGSTCSETLTVAATIAGDRTIGPWTLDAVDGHTHRATRFSSNSVLVHVLGPSPLESMGALLRSLGFAALAAVVLLAIIGFAAWVFVRALPRPKPAVAEGVPESEPPEPPRGDDPSLRELVAALSREPTRRHALALRAALRRRIGALECETYDDLVARRALGNGEAEGFQAVERAAFCEDECVAAAAREAVSYLTR